MLWKEFFLPANLATALKLKAELGATARFIAGGTDLVVDLESGRRSAGSLIDISRLAELHKIETSERGLRIGGGVTHAEILDSQAIKEYASVLAQAAIEVGSPQIRNRSTLAGNLITASPAADTVPPLLAMRAVVELESRRGQREVPVLNFITGFRQVALAEDEIVRSVLIPYPQGTRRSAFLKLGLRKAQAISVVSVSVVVDFDAAGKIVRGEVALGSVAPTPLLVPGISELMQGQFLTDELIEQLATQAMTAAVPISDVRGSAAYRKAMVKVYTSRALRYVRENKVPTPSADPGVFLRLPTVTAPQPSSQPDSQPDSHNIVEQVLELEVNGQPTFIENVGQTVLLYALRQAGLTGTKEGCFEGECGACTVLLDGRAVNSCLVPAQTAQNCQVQTVEGLAQTGELHALQRSFIQQGGVQCGFCTPGLLMSGSTLLAERPMGVSEWECRSALVGNLCRCTGYSKVLEAIIQASNQEVKA